MELVAVDVISITPITGSFQMCGVTFPAGSLAVGRRLTYSELTTTLPAPESVRKHAEKLKKSVSDNPQQVQVTFEMIRGPDFKALHPDGAWFGFDPMGRLHLSFFNDTVKPPSQFLMSGTPGNVADLKVLDAASGKPNVTREICVDIALPIHIAEQVIAGMRTNLDNAKKAGMK